MKRNAYFVNRILLSLCFLLLLTSKVAAVSVQINNQSDKILYVQTQYLKLPNNTYQPALPYRGSYTLPVSETLVVKSPAQIPLQIHIELLQKTGPTSAVSIFHETLSQDCKIVVVKVGPTHYRGDKYCN